MNKQDLVNEVAELLGIKKSEAERAVDFIFNMIIHKVKDGEKVSIAQFGIFTKRERKGRIARNPKTGESVTVESRGAMKFQPAKSVKELMK